MCTILSIANFALWVILHWTSILQLGVKIQLLLNVTGTLDELYQYGTLSLMETLKKLKDTIGNRLANNIL